MGQWVITHEGPIAILSMDDGKANVVLETEFAGLIRALQELKASDALAVVLAGRPGYFSAGLNLKLLPTLAPAELQAMMTRFGESVIELFLFPKPIVAAVGGHALGAGAIFGFACDVRLFAEGAFKFGLNEVPGGLFVPTYGIVTARSAAPAEQLTSLVLHGRVFSPSEALRLGVAESLHPPQDLRSAAIARAIELAELSGDGYAYTKQRLRGAMGAEALRELPNEVAHLAAAIGGKPKK